MSSLITPDQIADALGIHRPTPEQAEVISGPAEPTLVLAGAGSNDTAHAVRQAEQNLFREPILRR